LTKDASRVHDDTQMLISSCANVDYEEEEKWREFLF
jgi:hypothetical protein